MVSTLEETLLEAFMEENSGVSVLGYYTKQLPNKDEYFIIRYEDSEGLHIKTKKMAKE